MGHKTPANIKILTGLISFSIFITILFFGSIAPYRTIPILMYHSVPDTESESDILTLDKKIFKNQMEYLRKHNYEVVPLERAVQMMKESKHIPHNWVVLTFDDGYKDFYNNVYPIIKEYRFYALLFVCIDRIGKNENSLTWQELDKLRKDSLVTVGSHSLSHMPLVLLPLSQAKKEIGESKLILEKRLNGPINFFAYPYGALDESVKQMAKEIGYEAAVGIAYRRGEFKNNDIYVLKRVFVSKISRYPFVFGVMLSGYYVPARELMLRILNIRTPRNVWN